jgi:outer membrane receptor protein involved in Fe transport
MVQIHLSQGQYSKARGLADDAYQMALQNESELEQSQCLKDLAVICYYMNNNTEAVGHCKEALALQRKHLPDSHPDIAQNLRLLSAIYSRQGQYDSAQQALDEGMAIMERAKSDESQKLPFQMDQAQLHISRGELDRAEAQYNQLLPEVQRVYGPNSSYSVQARAALAEIYLRQNRYDKAQQMADQALAAHVQPEDMSMPTNIPSGVSPQPMGSAGQQGRKTEKDAAIPSYEMDQLFSMSLEELLNVEIAGVSKNQETLKEVPMSVNIVSREDMNRWGVRSLYEVFQRIPGYSFYNTDYYGQYGAIGRGLQSVWRYGFSFELMNVVDFGHWEFTPQFFKSVEIARGPSGLTWGSGAEAGLLNFNIRDDLEGAETHVEVGNYNRRAYDLLFGHKLQGENNNVFVGWHLEEQDFRSQTNAFDTPGVEWKENGLNPSQSLLAKIQYQPFKFIIFKDSTDHIAPRLWFGDDGLQEALEAYQKDVHDQLEVLAYRLEYHLPFEDENTKFYIYHNSYEKQWWMESVAIDTQRKQSVGFSGQTILFNDDLELNYGGDIWGEDQITAPSMTTFWSRTYGINWYDDALSPQKTSWRNGYLQGKYAINDKFKVLLGGRLDYENGAKDKLLFTGPQIGLFYDLTNELTVKYLYNDAKRRPQGNETTGGGLVSAEELIAHEFVIVYETGKLQYDVTFYTQKLQNQITRQNVSEELNAFLNTGGVESQGIEWSAKYLLDENTMLYWNGSWLNAEVIKGTVAGEEVADAHDPDDRPLFVPELTSFLGCEFKVASLFFLNFDWRSINSIPYQKASGGYSEDNVGFFDLTARTRKFWNDRCNLTFGCMNLLDNRSRVPAYGEHSGNAAGTIEPESRRFFIRFTSTF